jgi:hypothetical protein
MECLEYSAHNMDTEGRTSNWFLLLDPYNPDKYTVSPNTSFGWRMARVRSRDLDGNEW